MGLTKVDRKAHLRGEVHDATERTHERTAVESAEPLYELLVVTLE